MALTQRLDLRQSQSLVMTPQLQQAIKLLQLSNLELNTFLEAEVERNPLLEFEEGSAETPQAGEETPPATAETAPLDGEIADRWDGEGGNDSSYDEGPDLGGSWGNAGGGRFGHEAPGLEQTLSGEISLREHLLGQLNVDLHDPVDRVIGRHLINLLDESGYIIGPLEGVAEVLGCEPARLEATLQKLQGFDPPGVFARDLKECLAIQLRDLDRLDPAMETMIEHLDLLARHDMGRLMKLCGVNKEDLVDMISEIRALNPKPGVAFDAAVAQTIIPDVLMRSQRDGSWLVELNTESLPRVLVNNAYYQQVRGEAKKKEEKQYISEQFQSASWLVKSLHQRATTILRVASEIVRQQDAFFRHGVQHLRPLVLRDIASEIDMHESTVRPRGVYELKYFFTASIPSTGGAAAHSSESVRQRIKALVDDEHVNQVLSDDKIVEILKGEGIEIARRTVAKYREALGIASSVQRRRQKTSKL
ncbi:MAG: RNA polymerase factor sigma-54 [Alphaproteobacteria bacterium]|nr:RNA polymerase factor sigma-54 [Alphaproteobacteria bacterium]